MTLILKDDGGNDIRMLQCIDYGEDGDDSNDDDDNEDDDDLACPGKFHIACTFHCVRDDSLQILNSF